MSGKKYNLILQLKWRLQGVRKRMILSNGNSISSKSDVGYPCSTDAYIYRRDVESALLVLPLSVDLPKLFLHRIRIMLHCLKSNCEQGTCTVLLHMPLFINHPCCWNWYSAISCKFAWAIKLDDLRNIAMWKTTYCTHSTGDTEQDTVNLARSNWNAWFGVGQVIIKRRGRRNRCREDEENDRKTTFVEPNIMKFSIPCSLGSLHYHYYQFLAKIGKFRYRDGSTVLLCKFVCRLI